MIWCFRQGSFGCWCCLLPMWVAGCFKYLCMYYMLVYPGTTHTHTPTHTTRHSRRSGINANKWKHKYFQRFVVRANLFGTGQAQINLPEVGQGSERWAHWPESGPDRTGPDRTDGSFPLSWRASCASLFCHGPPAAKRFLSSPTQLNIEIYI